MNNEINLFEITMSYDEIMKIKYAIEDNLKKLWIDFKIELFKAIAWIAGGIGLSYLSYYLVSTESDSGGRYVIFYGAVIYGVIKLIGTLCMISEIYDDIEFQRKKCGIP